MRKHDHKWRGLCEPGLIWVYLVGLTDDPNPGRRGSCGYPDTDQGVGVTSLPDLPGSTCDCQEAPHARGRQHPGLARGFTRESQGGMAGITDWPSRPQHCGTDLVCACGCRETPRARARQRPGQWSGALQGSQEAGGIPTGTGSGVIRQPAHHPYRLSLVAIAYSAPEAVHAPSLPIHHTSVAVAALPKGYAGRRGNHEIPTAFSAAC